MPKYLFPFLLIALMFAACKHKEAAYTGFVLNNANNKPLKGVHVILNEDSTITDDAGHFALGIKGGSGSIVFKMNGFYTDSFSTSTNHSGEYMEENFKGEKIGLYPVKKGFSTLKAYLLSKEPPPLDTGVIYSSAKVKPFYKHDTKLQEYKLIRPDYYGFEKYYQPIIPVKNSHFNYDIKLGTEYINIKSLSINNIPCKLIVYSLPGENDGTIINFQLNSYGKNHQLRDALQLDSRFTFDIIYYSDFKIHGDGRILIDRYSINRFEQNKEGDIIGEMAKPDTVILHNVFQLNDNGDFIELKR